MSQVKKFLHNIEEKREREREQMTHYLNWSLKGTQTKSHNQKKSQPAGKTSTSIPITTTWLKDSLNRLSFSHVKNI